MHHRRSICLCGCRNHRPISPRAPIESNDDTRIMFERGLWRVGCRFTKNSHVPSVGLSCLQGHHNDFSRPLLHTNIHIHTLLNGFCLRVPRFFKSLEVFFSNTFYPSCVFGGMSSDSPLFVTSKSFPGRKNAKNAAEFFI